MKRSKKDILADVDQIRSFIQRLYFDALDGKTLHLSERDAPVLREHANAVVRIGEHVDKHTTQPREADCSESVSEG